MSLNLASPAFLLGLLGISLPILIHLLTRRHQTHIPFSAVYLLRQAQTRSVRKSRPNRLLLLVIRCLGVAALSLALAGPIFSWGGAEEFLPGKPAANVLILDDSYSMTQTAGDTTLFHHAVEALTQMLEKMPSGNHFSLIRASQPARTTRDWVQGSATVLKELESVQPTHQATDIGSSMVKAFDLLSNAPQEVKRIFLVTDSEKNGWDPDTFPTSPPAFPVTLKVIDMAPQQTRENQAQVRELDINQEFLTHRRLLRVRATVDNLLTDRPLKQARIALVAGGKTVGEDFLDIPAGGERVKEFTFPYLGRDVLKGYVEIQDDGRNVDNRRMFSYQPDTKIKVLIVDGDPGGVPHQHESFYLEKALNPFGAADSDIDPTISTLSELSRRTLSDFSMVILCNVRRLPFGYEHELERYVAGGGSLFVGLGDQVDARYHNENLGLLLPVTLQALNQLDTREEPFRLKVDFKDHPVLKVFKGKTLEAMKRIRFHSLYSVEGREDREFQVPMRFTNGYPVLVETAFGKGRVFLFTSSLDRDWNDFPIQPSFLPWVQRWVKYAVQNLESSGKRNLLVGEPFFLDESQPAFLVAAPGGTLYGWFENGSDRPAFRETWRPGTYTLYTPPKDFIWDPENPPTSLPEGAQTFTHFTVNVDLRESIPGKMTEADIRQRLPEIQIEFLKPSEVLSAGTGETFALTTPLFLVLAFMLLCEGWLVRRE